MIINENHTIFYEKYKPQRVQDLILPEKLKTRLQQFVDNDDIPNIGNELQVLCKFFHS